MNEDLFGACLSIAIVAFVLFAIVLGAILSTT